MGDETSKIIGRFGLWQIRLMLILWAPPLLMGYHSSLQYITQLNPGAAICYPSECQKITPSFQEIIRNNNITKRVFQTREFSSSFSPLGEVIVIRVPDHCSINKPIPDQNGLCRMIKNVTKSGDFYQCTTNSTYEYDHVGLTKTVVTEFNLICSRKIYFQLLKFIQCIGNGVGVLGIGVISDRFGRRNAINVSVFITIVSSILGSLMPEFISYSVVWFFMNAGPAGCYYVAFCYSMEMIWSSRRFSVFYWIGPIDLVGILYPIPFALGHAICSISGLAVTNRGWREAQLYFTIFTVWIIPFVYYLVPESLRWLLMMKKYGKAKLLVKDIVETNGTVEEITALKEIENLKNLTTNLRTVAREDTKIAKGLETGIEAKPIEMVYSETSSETSSTSKEIPQKALNRKKNWKILRQRHKEAISNLTKSGVQFFSKVPKPSVSDESSEDELDDQGIAFVPQAANDPHASDDLEYLHNQSVMYTFSDMFGPYLKYYTVNFLFLSIGVCYTNFCFDTVMELIFSSWSPLFGNVFNFRCLSAVIEIPTYLLVLLVVGKWGRRPLLGFLLFVAGFSLILLSITDRHRTVLFLLGKASSAGGNALMHVSIMMLYPTSIRNKALSLFVFVAWVASGCLELFIQYCVGGGGGQELNFILGTLGILSSMTALYLPETINNPLPETINDIRFNTKNTDDSCCKLVSYHERYDEYYPKVGRAKPYPQDYKQRWAQGSTQKIREYRTIKFGINM